MPPTVFPALVADSLPAPYNDSFLPDMALKADLRYLINQLLPAIAEDLVVVFGLHPERRAGLVVREERELERDEEAARLDDLAHLCAPLRAARGQYGHEETAGATGQQGYISAKLAYSRVVIHEVELLLQGEEVRDFVSDRSIDAQRLRVPVPPLALRTLEACGATLTLPRPGWQSQTHRYRWSLSPGLVQCRSHRSPSKEVPRVRQLYQEHSHRYSPCHSPEREHGLWWGGGLSWTR